MPLLQKKKTLAETLKEKGWDDAEIAKTVGIMQQAGGETGAVEKSQVLVYWMILIDLGIGNMLISFGLIPFLMVLNPGFVLAIVGVIGFVLGLFFNMLVWDLEQVKTEHHYAAMFFIPGAAILNMSIIVIVANALAALLKTAPPKNPYVISGVYIAAFIVPYIVALIRDRIKKRQEQLRMARDAESTKSMHVYGAGGGYQQ